MCLVPMTELLSEAVRGGYAVCYCESWNLESLAGVLEAAEETRSPIIAGFNGGFLAHPQRAKPENLAYYAGMRPALAEAAVPAAFLLNETDDFGQISRGIKMGFNAVMVENERLGPDEYRHLVKKVVEMAHRADATVEAAVGRLPDGSGESNEFAHITEAHAARAFVGQTGVDALAVSVGNVHILTQGKAAIDLDALRRIRDVVSVPLVLHGGSGIPLELARDVIRSGVAKINFGTVLKQAYLAAIREKLAEYRERSSPHPFRDGR
jgi:ketose-bisphosphate aldolase